MEQEKKFQGLHTSWMFAVTLVVVLVLVAAGVKMSQSKGRDAERPVSVQRLTGHVSSEAMSFDLTLAAILIDRGTVDGVGHIAGSFQTHGIIVVPSGLRGPVVEIIPPSNSLDSWCINVALSNPGLEGLNMLVYVRNVGDGKTSFDEVSFGGGPGATCADFSPETSFSVTVDAGDFKESL